MRDSRTAESDFHRSPSKIPGSRLEFITPSKQDRVMIDEHLIRNQLSDPDIEIQNVDEDSKGSFAMVVVSGTEDKLRRLTSEHFDIEGKPKGMEDGIHARLRPK